MPDKLPANSVELIKPHTIHIIGPMPLKRSKSLAEYAIANEADDELGVTRIAAGFHRMEERKSHWWESRIGPDRPIDTRRFDIVSFDNLGSMQVML